jgi:transposase
MQSTSNMISIPAEVLGLPDVEIIEVKINNMDEVIIRVKSTKKEIPCHVCGKLTEPHGKGQTVQLRHLPVFGKTTYIEITPPRGICSDCDKNPTSTQLASWYARKSPHTKAYEKYILLSLINSTITDVSIKEGLGCQAIQAIIDRQVATEMEWKEIREIGLLGLDEISLKKGRRDFVTIVTSRTDSGIRILAVLKGREKATVKAFLAKIPKNLHSTITAVCSDMYDGFVNAAKEVFAGQIPVIVDRFHVAQLYRKSLTSLRKKELKRLRKTLSEQEYRALKPAIALLCGHKEFLNPEEQKIVEPLFQKAPSLRAAYKLCSQLTQIFNRHLPPDQAIEQLNAWMQEVEVSKLNCYNTFIATLKKYQPEIVNYFINRHNSGFVEGVNNKIKVLKRRCYGITNLKHFFQRVFLDFSGYAFFGKNQSACFS